MNKEILKGQWKELKGEAKKKWGKLTDDDLLEIEGEADKLAGLLQKRYGYARDQAEKEYDDFINQHGKR